jgi:Tfp pilus assembly protein FimT
VLVLLTISLPYQKIFFDQSKIDIIKLQLLRAINLARQTALLRKEKVTVCESSNQTTCFGHWKEGYVVLSNGKVIYSFLNPVTVGELYWRAFPKSQVQLHYLPSGALESENGTFFYCLPGEKKPSWVIVFSQSGRAREIVPDQNGEMLIDARRKIYC